jgi:hypothetical protein
MANLQASKDTIRALDRSIQMAVIDALNKQLADEQAQRDQVAIAAAVLEIKTHTPTLTEEDGNQLRSWQEKRESGRPEAV